MENVDVYFASYFFKLTLLFEKCKLYACVFSFSSATGTVNHVQQTEPPSVAIIDLFPDAGPEGEIQEYVLLQDG